MNAKLVYLSGLVLLLGTVVASGVAVPVGIDKAAAYSEMRALAGQMATLKPNVNKSELAFTEYAAAERRYLELSRLMGGDDPGQIVDGGNAKQSNARPEAAPATPPFCAATASSFTQNVAVAIPTGPGVVTSTITVSGAETYLLDVDAVTNIPHTFPGDLDITITSPAGTVVTLTTDNAATNDDVFNGTLWDDDANPAGQVPYVTNNGMVTDHAYVILTTASPLVPEESMAAFIGEDPNGTWTLTVSDDLAGDGGSIDSWSLNLTTLPSAPITTVVPTVTQSTPVAIPTGPAVVTSTLVVASAGTYLFDANLTTNITHTFAADLDMTLTSPAGTVVTLTTDNGGQNDDVFNGTVWDDDANPAGQVPYTTNNGLVSDHAYVNLTTATPLVPEETFGAFIGEDPNGTWTLTISDDLTGDGGSIDSWSLDLTTAACPSTADVSITKTLTTAGPFVQGQTISYDLVVSNAGPVTATSVQVTDTPTNLAITNVSSFNCAALPCTIPSLASGASETITVTATITAAGAFDNAATADAVETDPTPGNDTDNTGNGGVAAALVDVSITKTLTTAGPFFQGDSIVYSLLVANAGPSTATSVQVTDTPTNLAITTVSGGGCVALPCSIPSLASGANVVITVTATISAAGVFDNAASVSSTEIDSTPGNNTDNTGNGGTATLRPSGVEVPTLSEWGLIMLGLLLAFAGAWAIRPKI